RRKREPCRKRSSGIPQGSIKKISREKESRNMRYCKFLSANDAPLYAFVEQRGDALWTVRSMQAPEEDHAAPSIPSAFQPAPLKELRLLAPVTPSKIVCIGRNYRDHAAELGNEVPKEPLLFLK